MGEVDSGCLAGFRHVGGASRPPEVPLTGCVRGEERGGEGVVVARRGPSWSLPGSLAKLVAAVAGGSACGEGRSGEAKGREREQRELERESEGMSWEGVSRA